MNIPRRHFLKLVACATALPAVSRNALAIAYPTRPVRVVVGFPPGGFTDTTTRLIAAWLSEKLGQQFVVENRPGASGNLATEAVARSAPDGYTLLQIGDGNAYNATLYGNLSFDFVRDIAPVASLESCSLARKMAAPTTSSGVPISFKGIMPIRYSRNWGCAKSWRFRSVSMRPGAIALTRML